MSNAPSVRFELVGKFIAANGEVLDAGEYTMSLTSGIVGAQGETNWGGDFVTLAPVDFDACRFTVHDVIIGVNFHWERKETQTFQGSLTLLRENDTLTVINELPLESYLVSVISSEMSAACPTELLRAHAVVSRSWLLAQLINAEQVAASPATEPEPVNTSDQTPDEIIRWYDRENHANFDVCADDHCQRYQGISKAFSPEAFAAIQDTRGKVLVFDDEVCDARYSKSCGGITEVYRAAWEEKDVAYLTARYDWQGERADFVLPLTDEANAEAWITASPKAYCNTDSKALLARILPGFDQETMDFYRWRVRYSQAELCELLQSRTGIDFGAILALEAVERGESGRIIRLKITGAKRVVTIGKELEIRRALSKSHLYSSAFIMRTDAGEGTECPSAFELIGAGWGHGVGLCQIGAAVMADSGFTHEQILSHYFKGAELQTLY